MRVGNLEDPELGVWLTISAGVVRGPASRLLAALTTTAAAQLGHSDVIDDYDILGHRRVNPPDPLADALHRAASTVNTTAPPGTNEHAEALLGALTATPH